MKMKIIKYCAEEVTRQRDTPIHVWHMCVAWEYAQTKYNQHDYLTYDFVIQIGKLVTPSNLDGVRKCAVYVGNHRPPAAEHVERLMKNLVENQDKFTPEEFYKDFQTIHPFVDGNGRTGKILYNFLKKTLDDPVMPPNFWGIANP